jgi:histidine ammonia-lyase
MTSGISEGRAIFDGKILPGDQAMALAEIPQIELEAKDGLAITNGAQLTTAIAAMNCHDSKRLLLQAEVVAAMSIEALRGASRAFHPLVHWQRPYTGARAVAANLCRLMEGSQLIDSMPDKVQDAYSLRCTPQVLGACRDMVAFASGQVEIELNAATDNPLILLDAEASPQGFAHDSTNHAYSAGMFHGEPVGMAMDTLKIGVAELASLSERRLYRLTTGSLSQRLPPGLARKDRPELGLVLPHTTAAALVSENKALGWPASLDSIPTCEDQEDHVAMSTTASRRAQEVVTNSRRVVAIELLGAVQALDFRLEEDPSVVLGTGTGVALERVRGVLGGLGPDATPSARIEALHSLLFEGGLMEGMPSLVPVGEAPGDEK